jgi:hypothetical protein
MKYVAMAISNENISCITDVYTIRIICDVLASNSSYKMSFFIEDNNTVTLKITSKIFLSTYGNV